MTLGEKIQQLRKAGGLSQEQLADMINVSRQAISKWETDQSLPELEKLLALSRVFAVSTDELLGNEASPTENAPAPQMKEVVSANMRKRKFTVGCVITVFGLLVLIVDFFALVYMQRIEREVYQSWDSNVLHYAAEQPMPIIFAITILMIAIGVLILVSSFLDIKVNTPVLPGR